MEIKKPQSKLLDFAVKKNKKIFSDFGKEKSDEQISWQAKKIRQIREDFIKNNFSMP